jgi:hypothetical protein
MKNILLYFIGMMVLFAACESGTHSSEQKTNDTTVSLNEPGKDTSGKAISTHPDIPELSPGKDTLQLNLEMHANQHVTIPVSVLSGDSIFGQLMPDDKAANIRFTQIAKPDQTFDGPFGRELSYSVKKPGRYALIIGQNLMAGDPWDGKFRLKVWVK